MSVYGFCRRAYHAMVPESVRRIPFLSSMMYKITCKFGDHDVLYPKVYFDEVVDKYAQEAAPIFVDMITREFAPKRVIDVGCGTGALLNALKNAGCECFGLEYAEAALAICKSRGLNVQKFDIEKENVGEGLGQFDLVTSMEVGEHLPASKADRYIDLLTSLSSTVLYTAAIPGQGGGDHVNEQPHEYWIEKYQQRGFQYDKERAERWRKETKERGMPYFYSDNIMIFHKAAK